MKTLLLIAALMSFSSIALANTQLQKNIAASIDGLMWDTVNEGDMTALVKNMTCKLAPSRQAGAGLAKCDVTFKIESNYTDETQRCEQSCFLIYTYEKATLKVLRGVETLEQTCIENLSSACD